MKKLFGNLLLLAIIGAVVSFFAAPAVAFFAIRSAADASDVAGLARLIDFPAIRQSLRPQLSGDPAALTPPPSFLEDPIGAVRRQLEQGPAARPDADGYLTPAALAALTRGEGRAAPRRTGPAAETARDPVPEPVFWGINRARLAIDDRGGARTVFTFERKGPFEWKLVHIGLPDAASRTPRTPAATPAPAAKR